MQAVLPHLALLPAQASSAAGVAGAPDPNLWRYSLGLAIVIALLIAALYGVRKALGRSGSIRPTRRSLEILEALPMGGSKRVCVVRCGERRFLVGMGDRELCALGELERVEAEATPVAEAAEIEEAESVRRVMGPSGRFRGLVHRALKGDLSRELDAQRANAVDPQQMSLRPQPPSSPAVLEARKRVADELLQRMSREGHPPIPPRDAASPKTIERLLREEGLVG